MTEQDNNSQSSDKRRFRTIHIQRNGAPADEDGGAPSLGSDLSISRTPKPPPAQARRPGNAAPPPPKPTPPAPLGGGLSPPADRQAVDDGGRPKLKLKARAGEAKPAPEIRKVEPTAGLRLAEVQPKPAAPPQAKQELASTKTTIITGIQLENIKPPTADAPAPPAPAAAGSPSASSTTDTTVLPLSPGTPTASAEAPVPPATEPPAKGKPRLQNKPSANSQRQTPEPPPAPTRESNPDLIPGIVSVVLVLIGEMIDMVPAWSDWIREGTPPKKEVATLVFILLVFGVLVLGRKRSLKIVAGAFAGIFIVWCVARIVLPRTAMTAGLLSEEIVASMAAPGLLALAATFYAAAIALFVGHRLVHWVVAGFVVAVGMALPFIDFGPVAPPPPPPAESESVKPPPPEQVPMLALTVPEGWVQVSDKTALTQASADSLYKCGENDLLIAVRHIGGQPRGSTLQDFASQLYQKHSDESVTIGSFVSKGEVPGKPNQRKMTILATSRTDILVVEKDGRIFTVTATGSKESFRVKEADIKQIFGAIN